jgi:hypothetical protein
VHSLEAMGIPLEERTQNHFSVTVGTKRVSLRLEFRSKGFVIVDFTVEDYGGVAIVGDDGLVAPIKIDNLEADGSEGRVGRCKDALLVRTPVG